MSGTEDMKDIATYCPHKDVVSGYCKKCNTYICDKCQMADHYEHIQSIAGLDSLFTEAINEYAQMSSSIEKHILAGSKSIKDSAIDETLLQIEKRIAEEYDKLIKDVKEIEEEQTATIRSTPYISKLQTQKAELEGEELKKLTAFDKKLGDTISQLLTSLSDENYEGVEHLITAEAKDKFAQEAKEFEPYYAKQKEFLKNLEVIKAVEPKLKYKSQLIEDLVQIKGVHEETLRLLLWDNKSRSVYCHLPKSKTVMKQNINNMSIPNKHAQIVIDDQMIIICGGKKKPNTFYENTYAFIEAENKIVEKAHMIACRAYHGIANRKDQEVYVAGGEGKEGLLSSAEMYDIRTNVWKPLPPLIKKRKNATLCICNEKYLYAIAGDIADIELLDLTERKSWESKVIKEMINVKKCGAVAVSAHEILIFGGQTSGKKSNLCFLYDILGGQLVKKAPLALPSCFDKGDSRDFEGFVYATGNAKANTHIYDKSSNKWTIIPEKDYKFKYSWD